MNPLKHNKIAPSQAQGDYLCWCLLSTIDEITCRQKVNLALFDKSYQTNSSENPQMFLRENKENGWG